MLGLANFVLMAVKTSTAPKSISIQRNCVASLKGKCCKVHIQIYVTYDIDSDKIITIEGRFY